MSYDLEIYGHSHDDDPVEATLISFRNLELLERNSSGMTVGRGARAEYAFMLEGPQAVDYEDLPEEVTVLALVPDMRLDLIIEGGAASAAQLEEAIRFARALATRMSGVVFDKQLDQAWSPKGNRKAAEPPRDKEVDLLQLVWHFDAVHLKADTIQAVLATFSRLLPEALPRRYGGYEPFTGALSEGGVSEFVRIWQETSQDIYFRGSAPVVGGSFSTPSPVSQLPVATVNLDLLGPTFSDPKWRDVISLVFQRVANDLHAFYGYGRMTYRWHWNGRLISRTRRPDDEPSCVERGSWWGLFPHPVWIQWFSGPYRELVEGRLPIGSIRATGDGVFNRLSDDALDRPGLEKLMCAGRADFVPAELRSEVNAAGYHDPSQVWHIPATVIPAQLRSFERRKPC